MIYTASFSHPEHHHGKLISISRSNPKGFPSIPKLKFLTPSKELLAWWKKSSQTDSDRGNSANRYYDETLEHEDNMILVNEWLGVFERDIYYKNIQKQDITLLCWEDPGEYCHRNDVGAMIAARASEYWGGYDVPQTKIETLVAEACEKGVSVKCDRLTLDDSFSLYKIILAGKNLGDFTRHGAENILSQLIKPTNSDAWFRDFGIDVRTLPCSK